MSHRDHLGEIILLGAIAAGVLVAMIIAQHLTPDDKQFDPSAYLVVVTLIVGAIKERWTQRSTDRATDLLGQSAPRDMGPQPPQEVEVINKPGDPVPVESAPASRKRS